MASYISNYTGKQIDNVIDLFHNKGLNGVVGTLVRNSDGTFGALESISWTDISNKPTTLEGYGLATEVADYVDANGGKIDSISVNGAPQTITAAKNVDLSVATLVNGKIPESQLPSSVNDILDYDTFEDFPNTGEDGKLYIAEDTNLTYRWGENGYVEVAKSLALGESETTAYRGDRGYLAYHHAVTNKGSQFESGLYKIQTNVEGHVIRAAEVQKEDITGLGIQESLVSGTNIKTINNQSIIGSGDIHIEGGEDSYVPMTQEEIDEIILDVFGI